MKLKFARPGWTKGTKLAQWGLILAVGTYGVVSLNVSMHHGIDGRPAELYNRSTNPSCMPSQVENGMGVY